MCSHWRIINASYERAEQCIDAVTTTFVDPPYQHNQYYREKFSDYEALAQWVRGLSGHVIVCEGAGADWLPFRELADVKAHPRSKEKTAKELVWTQFSR
jgi:16S rRNA G966 N2-methylase RsmD